MIPAVEWQQHAACRDIPTNYFYNNTVKAKEICVGCPVIDECLSYVLEMEEPKLRFGVWGGMTGGERKAVYDGIPETRRERKYCNQGHEFTNGNITIIDGKRRCVKCQGRSQARTHCKHGHDWVKNVVIRSGREVCQECERIRNRNRYREKVA